MRRKQSIVLGPGSRAESAPRREGAGDALAPFDAGTRDEWWWRQPKWSRREWTFDQGGRVIATLKGESLFSNTAHARFADAGFDVHHGWSGRFEVRPTGVKEPLARFVPRLFGGGRIEAPAGDRLELVSRGFWNRVLELRTEDELVLVRFESHDSLARHELQVFAEDPARRRNDLAILIALAAAVVFAPKRHSH